MGGEALRAFFALASAVIGLAVLAIIVSTRSSTATVLGSAGNALSSVIGAATSPVTGASVATSSVLPNQSNVGQNFPF